MHRKDALRQTQYSRLLTDFSTDHNIVLCIRTFGAVVMLSLWHCRGKKDKWVKEYQGQLLISTGAVQWTMDCSKALNAISGGNKTALKALKKKQVYDVGYDIFLRSKNVC